MAEEFIWSEKYRPKTIDQCILPASMKTQAKGIIENGKMPTAIFTGSAGCGKTTLARAIANELGADLLFINASTDGNIDAVRTRIAQFASTVSFSDAKKITILDEADGMSQQGQQALRGFIEEFSHNHSIIFTCNYAHKIIDPLKSRSSIFDFKIPNKEKAVLATEFLKRIVHILDNESVKYDKKAVAELVTKTFPDFRRCLNELQRYAAGGKIDLGIVLDLKDENITAIIDAVKSKRFNEMRKWVANNSDLESTVFFRMFYDRMSELLEPKSIPEMVLKIANYSYKAAFVLDQEINYTAFLTEVMQDPTIVFK